jgi:NADH-quinone oxidoreductase subunit J
LGCVISTNIVRMATCLFGTLGAVAILYFLMSATFLGAIQLIVYAGGTLIVIIFGVMLTSKSPWVKYVPKPAELVIGGLVCLALFGGLVKLLLGANWGAGQPNAQGFEVAQIGWALLNTYLVPFELASVLLLAVMIGAAYLARPERGE